MSVGTASDHVRPSLTCSEWLNSMGCSGGCCVLYTHRPMICRLHGIPHELSRPGAAAQRSPGCGEFDRRCGGMAYRRFDRTPFYAELARLEAEFRQALGVRRRFKHTIAEMLLNDRLAS